MSDHGTRAGRLSLIATAGALALRAGPFLFTSTLLIALVEGIAPVWVARSFQSVIDALVSSASFAAPAIGFGIGTVLIAVLIPVSAACDSALSRAVRIEAQTRLFSALHERLKGLTLLESPAFQDRVRLAQQAVYTGPNQLVRDMVSTVRAAILLTGFGIALAGVAPMILVFALLAAVPVVVTELGLTRRWGPAMHRVNSAERRLTFYSMLLLSPEAGKEIRLLGLGALLRRRMDAELRDSARAEAKVDGTTLRMRLATTCLTVLLSLCALAWAAVEVASSRMSVGGLTLVLAGVGGVQSTITAQSSVWTSLAKTLHAVSEYVAVVTVQPDLPTPERGARVPVLRDRIEFRDVWFRYAADLPWVLRGVSFSVPHGKAVALVGQNGAGKSTIVRLLCRLYEPDHGEILWDGVDIRSLPVDELRQRIGAVFQDYSEYEASVRDNVAFGDVDAADPEASVRLAVDRAGATKIVETLPYGLDTFLTRMFTDSADRDDPETGVILSGGQGQRLAFARAMMRADRDVMILDEPSSGLDAFGETELHSTQRRVRRGRASLLISHRLNTVRDADEIIVLDEGAVISSGTHAEQLRERGLYWELFEAQSRGYRQDAAVGTTSQANA
ncbi:ATP-binding cassette subfamily B protein [Curtobacterium sp. PhB25]|uniref:ABC transporter ATP-binding protein n=1 Tax=Curtobacterium sp. PhB25 TaxID=2485205 RepID=UPI001064406A|nr:ABC transporter ATP-binding protein [Curtobacterium sp. PhB25]TCU86525.1 ATP-binding cassette subfamily B protein [Curtobacterium sp. PhB191]TDW51185.1 ATP-binding cassette subfamily B protein [Curtobacterium sp. PhB42]TDW55969.1 ATP-binding cassette subfamily B protein [Curtobacterium sp. PhB190]TDW73239.1 ATP-binding cassette subfamily B protein [Curtobacterium sp. PhB25]